MVERIASAPRSLMKICSCSRTRFLPDIVGKPRRPQCAVDVLFIGIGAAAGDQAVGGVFGHLGENENAVVRMSIAQRRGALTPVRLNA